MPAPAIIQIQVDQPGSRLDQFLANAVPTLSRSQVQKLIRQGAVSVSTDLAGAIPVTRPSTPVQMGNVVTLKLPAASPVELQPQKIGVEVVFEDDDLVVVNKPAGLVVHPAQGHDSGTLVNALLARYPDLEAMAGTGADRPGIVHRLDRDTSGLIVVARTPETLRNLQQQFKNRTVEKLYLTLVFGQPDAPKGVIDVPLGRDLRHRQKFAARPNGKPARTHYRVKTDYGQYSLLEIGLETGRTHQIRVHLAWLKCPVVNDTVYGRKKNPLGLSRQFLHAWKLQFTHPRTGDGLQLEAPLPSDLQRVLDNLG